jgi:multidrug efflux pump
MIGVTAFGLFFTPVFYVVLRRLTGNRSLQHQPELATLGASANAHSVKEPVT